MVKVLRAPIVVITLIITATIWVFSIVEVEILASANAIFAGLVIAGPPLWRRVFWKKSEGEIINLGQDTGAQSLSIKYCYHVGAAEYEGTANENPKWHKKSQKIRIDYKPDQPANSMYTSNFSEFILGWGLISAGVLFLFLLY